MNRAEGSHLNGFDFFQRIKIRCYKMPRAEGSMKCMNLLKVPRYALGTFTTVYPNVINFQINNYSGGTGNITNGGGTFILDSRISITLNLSNSEKWQVVLRK